MVKGTDITIRALSEIKDEVEASIIGYGVDFGRTMALASSLGLRLNVLPKVPHNRLNEYYWSADVVIGGFKVGSLGMISLEAIACGRPLVTYVSSEYPQYADFPLKDINTVDEIAGVIKGASLKLWKAEHDYLSKYHAPDEVVKEISDIYMKLISV
jgi:glycosyltransferase involved in cell wall biosynthesis